MNRDTFLLVVLSVVVLLIQLFFIDRVILFGIRGDVVLIPIAALAIQNGRTQGMVYGFATGLILDMASGFLGVQALAKTIAGFVWGSFYTEGKPLINWMPRQFMQVFALGSVFHFVVYSGFNHLDVLDSFLQFFVKYLGGQTLISLAFAYLFRLYFWSRAR